MLSYAFVDGFTTVPQGDAFERLKRVIAEVDGVIADFAFFGARAMRVTVELDAGSIGTFRKELAGAEVELFPRCSAELDIAKNMTASHRILAMLHVAFA